MLLAVARKGMLGTRAKRLTTAVDACVMHANEDFAWGKGRGQRQGRGTVDARGGAKAVGRGVGDEAGESGWKLLLLLRWCCCCRGR